MKISDLVGSTTLSGFDRMIESRPEYEGADTFVDVEVVRVILGGTTYEFAENPTDGYRSSCEDPIVSKIRVQNTFAPVPVLCTRSTDASFRHARVDGDFLTIRNASTSATILVIGTDDIDDYYPSFICDFSAEAIGEIQETSRVLIGEYQTAEDIKAEILRLCGLLGAMKHEDSK